MDTSSPRSKTAIKARDILTSIGEVVYEWQAATDRLRWSNNAFDVLKTDILTVFPNGKSYTDLITPDTLTSRYRAIFGSGKSDDGEGVPFECIYCLAPLGFENELRLWVEESGRWFADRTGRAERVHGIIRVVNEEQHREQRLRFLSQFDALTGLFNRSVFLDQLQQTLEQCKEKGKEACFLIAHIDNFRVVNEAYGFDVADQVICEVARRISRRLRDGDLVGRISGTKFGLLINNCSEKEMSAAAALSGCHAGRADQDRCWPCACHPDDGRRVSGRWHRGSAQGRDWRSGCPGSGKEPLPRDFSLLQCQAFCSRRAPREDQDVR
nr:GGDEF domain-containing protein [uncultured Cohaesibacter sp.]